MANTVSVTQADREAAAALVEWHNDAAAQWEVVPGKTLQFFAASAPKSMRDGAFDDHDVVQAFARHRLASTQPAPAFPREEVADMALNMQKPGGTMPMERLIGYNEACRDIAAALLQGKQP